MSYILDALKRAERERKQGQVSVLDEISAVTAASQTPRRLPQGWVAAALVAAIVLPLAALLAWRQHSGKEAAAPLTAAAATAQAAPVSPQPQLHPIIPEGAPRAPAAPAATIEDGGRIATLDDVYGQAESPAQHPQRADQIADQTPDQAPDQQTQPPAGAAAGFDTERVKRLVAAAVGNRMAEPSPTASGDAGDAPDAAAAADSGGAAATPPSAPQAQQQAAAAPESRQQLQEMPEAYRANFPAFTVDVHAYDEDPHRRFVMINGKRYHEGDTLAQGPRIVGIVPQGMVLDWQGQEVLYAIAR